MKAHLIIDQQTFAALGGTPGHDLTLDDETYARCWWMLWSRAWHNIGNAHATAASRARLAAIHAAAAERMMAANEARRIAREAAAKVRAEECRVANAAWAAELAHRRARERRFEPTLDPCPVHGVGRSWLDEQLDAACSDSLWDGEFPARGPLWKLIAELEADRS